MRQHLIAIAAAAIAVAAAAPAAGQTYAPAYTAPNYGYPLYSYPRYPNPPYEYPYSWSAPGFVTTMQGRVQQIRRDIRGMVQRNALTRSQFYALDQEAFNIEVYIHRAQWSGLYPAEAESIENQTRRLEQNVMRAVIGWRPGYYARPF